jgi:ribonuclease PH
MTDTIRVDARTPRQIRPTRLTPHFLCHAEGSVMIEVGRTRVICAASVDDRVPTFLRGTSKGWVTAEYGMIPRATTTRTVRESTAGKVGGRTQEIQRLIGRSLRAVTKLDELGERTIWIDCDVIQADGGTRTASITGGFVALVLALARMRDQSLITTLPIQDYVAAISVGVIAGEPMLDLAYEEDSRAHVDMNVVKTGAGRFIEVQGTAEGAPFDEATLRQLLDLADVGIRELIGLQQQAVGDYLQQALGARTSL